MDSTTYPRTTATSARSITSVDFGLLLFRLSLGAVFIAHGGQKMFGWFGGKGLEATVNGMAEGGIPVALAYLAAFTEFFGGIAMIIGLFTRLAGLGLGITMAVAVLKVHLADGFFKFEFPLVLMLVSFGLMLTGPGKLAIADLEARLFRRK